jgi:RHS repeat-associated protein
LTEAAYTLEPEAHGNLVSQHRDLESSFYHYDAQGTTAALTDPSEVIAAEYVHDAWGNALSETSYGSAPANPYTYVGEQGYVKEPGYQHLGSNYLARRRLLNSPTGRWTSQDPLEFSSGDENFYRYVKNRPANDVDPSGLVPAGYLESVDHSFTKRNWRLCTRYYDWYLATTDVVNHPERRILFFTGTSAGNEPKTGLPFNYFMGQIHWWKPRMARSFL